MEEAQRAGCFQDYYPVSALRGDQMDVLLEHMDTQLRDSVAVCPLMVVTGFVQGLEASAQAVTVTVLGTQVKLLLGTDSS